MNLMPYRVLGRTERAQERLQRRSVQFRDKLKKRYFGEDQPKIGKTRPEA